MILLKIIHANLMKSYFNFVLQKKSNLYQKIQNMGKKKETTRNATCNIKYFRDVIIFVDVFVFVLIIGPAGSFSTEKLNSQLKIFEYLFKDFAKDAHKNRPPFFGYEEPVRGYGNDDDDVQEKYGNFIRDFINFVLIQVKTRVNILFCTSRGTCSLVLFCMTEKIWQNILDL